MAESSELMADGESREELGGIKIIKGPLQLVDIEICGAFVCRDFLDCN